MTCRHCPNRRRVGRPAVAKLPIEEMRLRLLSLPFPGESPKDTSLRLGYNPQALTRTLRVGASEATVAEWEQRASASGGDTPIANRTQESK